MKLLINIHHRRREEAQLKKQEEGKLKNKKEREKLFDKDLITVHWNELTK